MSNKDPDVIKENQHRQLFLKIGTTVYHTKSMTKITISLPEKNLDAVDELVKAGVFPNRSRALSFAAEMLVKDKKKQAYLEELDKLSKEEEIEQVDEWKEVESEWPTY
ncbi:MAG: hypothetical protein HQK66_11390 [Desulfamplus sp.]|nr:hypothetical protein [Desulfamplus sp.]